MGMIVVSLSLYAGKFHYGQWAKVVDGPLKDKIICIRGSIKNEEDLLDDYFLSIRDCLQNYDEDFFIDLDDEMYYGNLVEDIGAGYCFSESLLQEVDREDVRRVNDQLPFTDGRSITLEDIEAFIKELNSEDVELISKDEDVEEESPCPSCLLM